MSSSQTLLQETDSTIFLDIPQMHKNMADNKNNNIINGATQRLKHS